MNEKLTKIASILGITLSSSEVIVDETLSIDAKLMDGTMIYTEADSFSVGATVMVVAEDGSKAPVFAGEHQLEDGSFIVTDEAGVIIEVKPAAEDAAPIDEELSDEEIIDEEVEVKAEMTPEEKTAIVNEVMQILEPRIAALEEVLLGAVSALSKTNTELSDRVEKLSAQPAAAPVAKRIPVKEENALAGLKLGRK
jgi:hypothetical protein